MGHRFADLLFSAPVRAVQREHNTAQLFSAWQQREDFNHQLTERETSFIRARDSFYLATVSPDGWPYIQHRGGPPGFVKVLDNTHIGFADYRGNRQYISTGNLRSHPRVALFFMDYAHRRRLKMLGLAREISLQQMEELQALTDKEHPARVERGFVFQVTAFDWNCSQHITPRYDQQTVDALMQPLQQ